MSCKLRQQVLRLVAVAGLGQVLDLVEHALADRSGAFPGRSAASAWPCSGFCCARSANSRRNSFIASRSSSISWSISSSLSAVLQRLLQRLLRLAQALLGGRQVAVLDATAPSPTDSRRPRAAGRRCSAISRRVRAGHDAEIVRRVVDRVLGPQRDRVDQVEHARLVRWRRATRILRCSTTALASGLVKGRSGRTKVLRLGRGFLSGVVDRPSASA